MPHTKKRLFVHHKTNKVLTYLTVSDVFTYVGYTVLSMLGGLYLEDIFYENTIKYIGMGTAIFYLVKAIAPMPFGKFLDDHKSDVDEIIFISVGSTLMGIAFMSYPLIDSYSFYLFVQVVIGIGYALNVSAWRKMFARSIDKGREGVEYGIYETIMSISMGVVILAGGFIANISRSYFGMVFVGLGAIAIIGGVWGLLIFSIKDRKTIEG